MMDFDLWLNYPFKCTLDWLNKLGKCLSRSSVWWRSQNENPESKCGLNKSCFLIHVTGAFNELWWSLIITVWPSVQGWVWKCLKVLKSFWRVYTGLHLDSKNSKLNLNSSGSVKESPLSFISKALSNSLQLLVDSL